MLSYLRRGSSLTNIVALTCLGVGSLSSRVAELRALGYTISDTEEVDRFQRRYKKYFIAEEGTKP